MCCIATLSDAKQQKVMHETLVRRQRDANSVSWNVCAYTATRKWADADAHRDIHIRNLD